MARKGEDQDRGRIGHVGRWQPSESSERSCSSWLPHQGQVWSAYSVLNVLYSLIQKSKINEFIIAKQQGKSEAEIA